MRLQGLVVSSLSCFCLLLESRDDVHSQRRQTRGHMTGMIECGVWGGSASSQYYTRTRL